MVLYFPWNILFFKEQSFSHSRLGGSVSLIGQVLPEPYFCLSTSLNKLFPTLLTLRCFTEIAVSVRKDEQLMHSSSSGAVFKWNKEYIEGENSYHENKGMNLKEDAFKSTNKSPHISTKPRRKVSQYTNRTTSI